MIGFSFSRFLLEVFWPSWLYSVPWKTREGYWFWGKGITSELEGRFHETGCGLMRAFVAGKGSVEVLGCKINGEHGELSWSHLTFTLPLYLRWQSVFFLPFTLEANRIGTLLDSHGFLVTLVMMMTRNGLTQNLCLCPPLYIPSQDNEEPHPSIWLVS